jgi:glycosyltransferase involved in cell wall biosynthesis
MAQAEGGREGADWQSAESRSESEKDTNPLLLERQTVSVVIPALNEAESLPYVLQRIPKWIHEVILVDGHSTDGTVEVARSWWPSVRIVNQEGQGKGAALRSGVEAATGDIIITLDADGSTDPADIPAFAGALLSGADFVKGTRFIMGSGSTDMTPLHLMGNRALVALTNLLFGTRYSDITYGYNALWSRHRQALALEVDDWSHEIVSTIRVARRGLKVVEVASFEHRRVAGEAKLQAWSAGWVILKAILSEWLKPIERSHPNSSNDAA